MDHHVYHLALGVDGAAVKFSGRIAKPRTRPSVDCGLPEQRMPCFPGRVLKNVIGFEKRRVRPRDRLNITYLAHKRSVLFGFTAPRA